MKKILQLITISITIMLINTISVYAASSKIDTSNSSKGYITVTAEADMVVQISKDKEKYNYTLEDSEPVNFPLQLGSGSYKILVLKKVYANKYSADATETVDAKITENTEFLNSIQLIEFNENMISIKDMTDVISKGSSEADKTSLLYSYVVNKFAYDYDKASSLANVTRYLPVIDKTYTAKKGICYDISSLLAGVLRKNGIPTKLVMGYTPNVSTYHAWNEVYYDGQWHVIDATYDIGALKANKKAAMIKSSKDYSVTKLY